MSDDDAIRAAAALLLSKVDKIWTPNLSTSTHNARQQAERNGHKYRVIDREGFRAALSAIAQRQE